MTRRFEPYRCSLSSVTNKQRRRRYKGGNEGTRAGEKGERGEGEVVTGQEGWGEDGKDVGWKVCGVRHIVK